MSIEQRHDWITGEEFNRERRRLIDAGVPDRAPEFQALYERLGERDDYLYERFGKPYLESHPGQWIAISADGEVIIHPDPVEVMRESRRRFGPGNASLRRLADPPGFQLLTPRLCPPSR